ncbi:MAG: HAD-IA family hydrolase [Mariprofundaceae bacterium]|nr:HAD-IA family hydrolase [Mariprofundaceae bacterium]
MSEPRLILFDCDGTLMDSHHHIIAVMQRAFVEHGLTAPAVEAIAPVVGLSLAMAVRQLLAGESIDVCDDVGDEIAQTYRHLYRTLPAQYGLFDGVIETLEVLRDRGYWLGVVTGKSQAGLVQVLDKFDLAGHFLVLRTADQCPSKPHPAMVEECMREMGVTAAQTTVIGDALLDIQMAEAGGVRALGVSFGVADTQALREVGAKAVVDDFSDLLEHFPHLRSGHPSSTIRI